MGITKRSIIIVRFGKNNCTRLIFFVRTATATGKNGKKRNLLRISTSWGFREGIGVSRWLQKIQMSHKKSLYK